MGMDLYFRRDIANVLQAVAKADRSAQAVYFEDEGKFQGAYHIGFQAALAAVGLGFGLKPVVSHLDNDGPTWIEGLTNE